MKVVPNINQEELAEALGIGLEAIRKLRREGLPATKKANRLQYDPLAVFEWCISTGRHKHANRIAGKFPDIVSTSVEDTEPISETADLDAYVDRVRFNECALHVFVRANADNKEGLVWAIANYKDACKQRLEVEREISRIRLDQSKSIPRDEVNRQFAEVGQVIKNRLMAMPGAMAAILEGKNKAEINDTLTDEVRRVLEELSK